MKQPYQHALPAGTRVESYEIRGVLGVGGFGITYRAYDHDLQCDVAIKEYLPGQLAVRNTDGTTVVPKSDGDRPSYEYGLRRFLDEARTLAKFREAHIVRVIRYLEAHHTAYLVMDYEDGESLSAVLTREVCLNEERITAIVMPVLRSLRAVHAKKFLHRDIKPANIYLRRDESPVLLDFGSARQALEQTGRALTGMVTPGYAPVEQYFPDGRQGPWTDIYAIGATMYHCATGAPPTVATERLTLLQNGEPDPLGEVHARLRRRFSPPFLDTLTWMLEPNAKDRPQTVEAVADALLDPGGKRTKRSRRQSTPPAMAAAAPDPTDINGGGLRPEVLQAIEVNLERHVGPMSKALVRKAAAKSRNAAELSRLLADFLPTDEDRTAFLAQTQRLDTPPVATRQAVPDAVDVVATGSPVAAAATSPPGVDDAAIERAERALSVYLGPFARVLVKNAARHSADTSEFYQLLADELATEDQRHEFLRAVTD